MKNIRICEYVKCKKEYTHVPTHIQYEVKSGRKVYLFCSHDCKAKFLRERSEKRAKSKMRSKELFEGNYRIFIEPLNDSNLLIKDSFTKNKQSICRVSTWSRKRHANRSYCC